MSGGRPIVFLGPTLSAAEARPYLEDALYLPPVSQGDVYRAARERPWGIGIVDGYFGRVPAVWHKEILWAMAAGIHVFGAASMGALRAAELAAFGMEGVGAVFAAYAAGRLSDDDEVAVVHGPASTGFRPLSEAMVNIRCTLDAALAAGVVGEDGRRQLLAIAKATFYPRRGWPALLAAAAGQVAPAELAALAGWLPAGRVDQKRADAQELLSRMAAQRAAGGGPKRVAFRFQHTDAWEEARRQAAGRPLDDLAGGDTFPGDAVLEELRHRGERYAAERERALARALALEVAALRGMAVSGAGLESAADELRRTLGLRDPADLAAWLAAQELTAEGFLRWAGDSALDARVRALAAGELSRHLHDRLRESGDYGALLARARAKHAALAERGLAAPAIADCDLPLAELWRWYFEQRLGMPVPADLAAYARSLDLPGEEALLRAVLRERCFALAEAQNR